MSQYWPGMEDLPKPDPNAPRPRRHYYPDEIAAKLAALVAGLMWVGGWITVCIAFGTNGIEVAGAINLIVVFACCFWYAVFNL